jgi:hypothetical protein
VLIGRNLDEDRIPKLLNDELLTDDEFQAGPRAGIELPDPLPSWQVSNAASMVDQEADRIQREEELSEWQEFR